MLWKCENVNSFAFCQSWITSGHLELINIRFSLMPHEIIKHWNGENEKCRSNCPKPFPSHLLVNKIIFLLFFVIQISVSWWPWKLYSIISFLYWPNAKSHFKFPVVLYVDMSTDCFADFCVVLRMSLTWNQTKRASWGYWAFSFPGCWFCTIN